MIRLFFSYSHKDESLRDQLATHLAGMQRQGVLDAWHDRMMLPGDHLDAEIKGALEQADIVLLLVSADFIASDYCYDVEMTRAVERHQSGQCRVIPVILRPCDWHGTPFGKLLATPRDGKAVTQWANIDEAFLDIAKSIRTAADYMRDRPGDGISDKPAMARQGSNRATIEDVTPGQDAISWSEQRPTMAVARSTVAPSARRLRLGVKATDAEKDQFLEEAFEVIALRFETDLRELEVEHPSISTKFKRIDADRFIATIYVDGSAKCRCKVWFGRDGFASGIAYSGNQSSSDGSFNENLSIEQTDDGLRLKALGIAMYGNLDRIMTPEEAAGYYWSLFVRPIS